MAVTESLEASEEKAIRELVAIESNSATTPCLHFLIRLGYIGPPKKTQIMDPDFNLGHKAQSCPLLFSLLR